MPTFRGFFYFCVSVITFFTVQSLFDLFRKKKTNRNLLNETDLTNDDKINSAYNDVYRFFVVAVLCWVGWGCLCVCFCCWFLCVLFVCLFV